MTARTENYQRYVVTWLPVNAVHEGDIDDTALFDHLWVSEYFATLPLAKRKARSAAKNALDAAYVYGMIEDSDFQGEWFADELVYSVDSADVE